MRSDKVIPSIAVIRANKHGDNIVAAISVRDRLIKTCISSEIKRIIVILPSEEEKTSYLEHANEKTSTVEQVAAYDQLTINQGEYVIDIEDGFLVHPSLLADFLASDCKNLKSPTNNKTIFSKNNSKDQPETVCARNEIFEVKQDNIREARTRLFTWLSKKSDGIVSKIFNRPISTFFSKFFSEYPIHPIYFTALTALFALLMTYALLRGGDLAILWGCVLFHVASVVDGIDGEIARVKFQISLKGAKIDTTVDMITNILFMGGMSYALWVTFGDGYFLFGVYIVAFALLGVLMMAALLYFGPGGGRFDILANTIKQRFIGKPRLLKIFNAINYSLKRDAFALLFALLGVFGFGKYIPELLILGLVVWNLAIIINAKAIIKSEQVTTGL